MSLLCLMTRYHSFVPTKPDCGWTHKPSVSKSIISGNFMRPPAKDSVRIVGNPPLQKTAAYSMSLW